MSIPFFIDEKTGEVNVSDALDREIHEKYIIKVEVRLVNLFLQDSFRSPVGET